MLGRANLLRTAPAPESEPLEELLWSTAAASWKIFVGAGGAAACTVPDTLLNCKPRCSGLSVSRTASAIAPVRASTGIDPAREPPVERLPCG